MSFANVISTFDTSNFARGMNTTVGNASFATPVQGVGSPGAVVMVATMTVESYYRDIPTSTGRSMAATFNLGGIDSTLEPTRGTEWVSPAITANFVIPPKLGCPYDSHGHCEGLITNGNRRAAVGCPDDAVTLHDLLTLLAEYASCSPTFAAASNSNCRSSGQFVGYPIDAHPENLATGTFGNGIVNVHDLLGLLANYHVNYAVTPCWQ
jgi:hypothetical protein